MKIKRGFFEKISIVATIITAISSLFGLYLIFNAADSLKETKNANQGNFILTLNRDFFTNDKFYNIRIALDKNQSILQEDKGSFTDEELDDYIGFFDTLSGLIDRKILDYQLVDENFGYYIKQAYDNSEIKTYAQNINKQYGKDVYQGFDKLGGKISKEEF